MAKNINISELDFNSIKNSITNYMAADETFSDYSFEGSALSSLTDLLAYNTYYNSFYLNMIANEMFLDTARMRNNVASKAKLLGYLPTSARSARATISATFEITNSTGRSNTELSVLKINRDFVFKFSDLGIDYRFVPDITRIVDRQRVEDLGDGTYKHVYEIFDLVVVQGVEVVENYVVDTTDPNQKFFMSNSNVDTTSLRVLIRENRESSYFEEFKLNTDTMKLSDISRTYFLQESHEEKYEVVFGDGVLGKELITGNVVSLTYLITDGAVVNGLTGSMNLLGKTGVAGLKLSTEGAAPDNLTIIGRTFGGADRETTDSIRFYAPRTFEGQNRAVTVRDYMTIIPKIFPQAESMNVWGGEDNDPPQYGRIFMSIKPSKGLYLSSSEKDDIITKLMRNYSVVSLKPVIMDPEFLRLKLTIQVKYDDESTLIEESELKLAVRNSVIEYNRKFLNDFNSYFRYSQLLATIDETDTSITNNLTTMSLINEQSVTYNTVAEYTFNFSNALQPGSVYSNGFNVAGSSEIYYLDDNSLGSIRFYTVTGNNTKVYSATLGGTINYTTGTIVISGVAITSVLQGDSIGVVADPASNDIFPVRNQIIYLDLDELEITMLPDTDEFNENYEISTQRVQVSRSVETSFNNTSGSISDSVTPTTSVTRVYGTNVGSGSGY
jgi:hypothetical protein|tara:strand:+ start:13571 stop:15577 length:2007 start_codon:yes stop_codon:yes gene_type:complete